MPRQRIHVELAGLISVHAVRAVQTALAGVPGIESAQVSMVGAVLDCREPIDEAALVEALSYASVTVRSIRTERGPLPLL